MELKAFRSMNLRCLVWCYLQSVSPGNDDRRLVPTSTGIRCFELNFPDMVVRDCIPYFEELFDMIPASIFQCGLQVRGDTLTYLPARFPLHIEISIALHE
jgi:hypothetical protein